MKKLSIVLCLLVALVALMFWMPKAGAFEGYYTANCQACHGTTTTCNGCHAHGVHSGNAKNDINVTGVTDKTTYSPGETVSVTINGGYRTGWIRAILYDQGMVELARSTGTIAPGAIAPCCGPGYPITLTAPAPMTGGTFHWHVSWYGNQFDLSQVGGTTFFGPGWTPDPNNPNHGEEIVSTNEFTVMAVNVPDINLSSTSLDFGIVPIGGSVTLTTQVQNLGNTDLNVTSIALCANTSAEYTWSPAAPFTLAPGGSQTLSVTYTPVDLGTDTGCLAISSNDPDESVVNLNVTGTGQQVTQPDINLSPTILDFGTITLPPGGPVTMSTQVQNLGNTDLNVTNIALCANTSAEYTWSPAAPFTLAPGGSQALSVTYTPVDIGTDTGCLAISSNDPDELVVTLDVTGNTVPPPTVDYDIVGFRCSHRATVGDTIRLKIVIKNMSTTDPGALLTVTGMQGTMTIPIADNMPVTDPAGNGRTTYTFTYTVAASGNINWTAMLTDADPDMDQATCTTIVVP